MFLRASSGRRQEAQRQHATRRHGWCAFRTLLVEEFEDRRMLDAGLVGELRNQLASNFSPLNTALRTALSSQQLPLIGAALGTRFDPLGAFAAPLSQLPSSPADILALAQSLDAIPGIDLVDPPTSAGDPAELRLKLTTQATITVPLANSYGPLHLDLGGAVDVAVGLDFQFTVAAIYSGPNNMLPVAYVDPTDDVLKINAVISGSHLNATARLGFADISVTNGAAQFAGSVAVNLSDPGVAVEADGRIKFSELTTALGPPQAQATSGPSLEADITSSLVSGSKHLAVAWPNVNDTTNVNSNLASLGAYAGLEQLAASTFASGLSSLADWFGAAGSSQNLLGRPMPVVGLQLKDILDLGGQFKSRLVNQVGSYGSAQALQSRLSSVGGLSNVATQLVGNELFYTLEVNVPISKGVNVDLGMDDLLDLELDANLLNLQASVVGSIKFGVDLATHTFFLADDGALPELRVNAAIDVTGLAAAAHVGFVSVSITNGSIHFSANASLDAVDPGGDHRISTDDLAGGASTIGSFVGMTLAGSANVQMTIDAPLLAISNKPLTADWPDINNPTSFTTNAGEFAELNSYKSIAATQFSFGLTQLTESLVSFVEDPRSGNPLLSPLPLVKKSIAELIDLDALFHDSITKYADTIQDQATGLLIAPFETSQQLLNKLKSLPGSGPDKVSQTIENGDLKYKLQLDQTIQKTFPFELDVCSSGVCSTIDLHVTGSVTVHLVTYINWTFGVNKETKIFFVETAAGPELTADTTVALNLNSAGRMGFLGITVAGATATLNTHFALDVLDTAFDDLLLFIPAVGFDPPDSPGKLTTTELLMSPLAGIAQADFSGTASVALPMTTLLGNLSRSGTLRATWADVKDACKVVLDKSEVQDFLRFQFIEPASVLDGIKELPNVLRQMAGTDGVARNLPVLGTNAKDLITLAEQLDQLLATLAQFDTAQELEQALESKLAPILSPVSVDVQVAGDLRFALQLHQGINAPALGFNINEQIGGVNFQTGGQVSATGAVDINLTLGVTFECNVAANERFFIATGTDPTAPVSQARLSLGIQTTQPLAATATLGGLLVAVSGGSITLSSAGSALQPASIAVPLKDPQATPDGKLTLKEIRDLSAQGQLASLLAAPITNGKLHAALPIDLPPPPDAGPLVINADWQWQNPSELANPAIISAPELPKYLALAQQFDIDTLLYGLQLLVTMFQRLASDQVLNTRLPLVNKTPAELLPFLQKGITFFQQVRSDTGSGTTASTFETVINDAIVRAGFSPGEIVVGHGSSHNPSAGQLDYVVTLHFAKSQSYPFNLGMGGDLLSLTTAVTPSATFDATIEFRVNPQQGFYIVDQFGSLPEFHFQVDVLADPLNALGKFGPLGLNYGVKNGSALLSASFDVNLVSPTGPGGPIGTSQLVGTFQDVVKPKATANASINLPLGLRIGDDGPGVTADFAAFWNASDPGRLHYGTPTGSTDPVYGFSHVKFELGEWMGKVVGQVLTKLQVNNPLPADIIDVMLKPLPILNVKPIDVLLTLGNLPKEVKLVFEIAQLVANFSQLSGTNLELDLSGYLGGSPPANKASGSETGGDSGQEGGALDRFLDRLRDDYNIRLPVLDNFSSSAISTILGQPTDLIIWDPGRFSTEKVYNYEFPIATYGIPFLADVSASGFVEGKIGFFAELEVGLSTRGLIQHQSGGVTVQKLIDGFFLGDNRPGAPDTPDGFEVGFFGEVQVGIAGTVHVLGFDAAKLTGGGGIHGEIGLDVADLKTTPSGDALRVGRTEFGGNNRIYLDEIQILSQNYDISCILTLGGTLSAFLEVGVKALCAPFGGPCVLDKSARVEYPIVDWELPCDDPEPAVLATVQFNTLVMLPDAYPQVGDTYRNPSQGEIYTQGTVTDVSADGLLTLFPATRHNPVFGAIPLSEPVVITDPRLSEENRTSIFIHYNADNQPNSLRIQRVRNQVVRYQDIPWSSVAGINKLVIEGTVGHDRIRIDPRVTELIPSLSQITVNSGFGDDRIDFGLIDPALSHLVSTTIDAGSGDDQVLGTFTTDVILGGRGNDQLSGEDGNDEIHGGSGDDEISGGKGNDTLYGNGGADNLLGQLGDNRLFGNSGDDTIVGSDGNDYIEGDGVDPLFPVIILPALSEGADYIIAGAGNDVVHGGGGNDRIFAGAGIDFVFGEGGSDEVHGDEGDDYLEADTLNASTFLGGIGNDSIDGGDGFDVLIQTVNANQTLTNMALSGQGSDTWQDLEQIRLTAGAGDNTFDVSGFTGTAFLDGGSGSDRVVSTRDVDITLSDWNLTRSDGAGLSLISIEVATLTGGSGDNRFDVTQWTGSTALTGGGGLDTVYTRNDADFVLSDASLTRSTGGSFTLAGIQRAELSGGLGNNTIDASAFSGTAILAGGEGNDTLRGGSGDDDLDGGLGADALFGNAGRDNLVAGGGVGDALDGGEGDDILIGSDDGADILRGAPGRDRLLGHGGNDQLFGGAGDDILDGGPGDDTLSGDAGSDLAIGGSGHDTLYGQNAANSDADNAPDFLYGDFGTNANETGSGRDRLFGNNGNDRLFGEGDDDLLDGGTGTDDRLDYGTGESIVPADFVPPTPTPDPIPQAPNGIRAATGSLPVGILEPGRWSELFGSASGVGLSGDAGQSIEPALVADVSGPYVVWSDNRNGNFEIYLARQTLTGWQELAGSAHDGGISATAGASRRPSVALNAAGNPIVAWTEVNGTSSDIRVAQYDPAANGGTGGWAALGSSLAAGGISGTGAADNSRVVMTVSGPVVAWLDRSSGVANVYVRHFSGGQWNPLGANSATGSGVSLSSSDVSDLALATDASKVAVAWKQIVSGAGEIYVSEFSGSSWQALAGSASGGGISNTAGNSTAPSLAYLAGSLFAAWQDDTSGRAEIYAAHFNGTSWGAAGNGAAGGGGVSNTRGAATRPQLAVGGGKLKLLWTDDRVANLTGNSAALYTKAWNDTAFVEELKGDASGSGISTSGGLIQAVAAGVDPAGDPFVAWQDLFAGQPEIYVRGNRFDVAQVYYVNDDTPVGDAFTTASGAVNNSGLTPALPKPSVQAILDAYTLGPGDVILVDAGSYENGFALNAADSGVLILGTQQLTSVIEGPVLVDGATNVTLSRLSLARATTVRASNRAAVTHSVMGAGLTIDGGSDITIAHNRIVTAGTAVRLTGGTAGAAIESNTILAGSVALARGGLSRPLPAKIFAAQGIVIAGAASNVWLRGNQIAGVGTGISLNVAAEGRIEHNDIAATGTGIKIAALFSGPIRGNDIFGANVGVDYAAAAELTANRIYDNDTGVVSTVAGNVSGLGFVGSGPANEIFANTTGVQLTGQMQGQHVYANVTGISGSGILGGSDLDHANLIERNATGVSFNGRVAFNRISRNTTGIAAGSQLIDHNLIYRNTVAGIQASGNARVVQNTFYTTQGANLVVAGAGGQIEVENNIFWADGGYDLMLSGDLRSSFFSDYNNLYAEESGTLVHWIKDFSDVLDWQADVARWDLHSTGRTAVNPQWAQPQFMDLTRDDFRVFELATGLRRSSPTIDAGDPRLDLALSPGQQNLLANSSFENGLAGWNTNTGAAAANSSPGAFDGSAYFLAGTALLGFAEQIVDLTAQFTSAQLDSQDLVAVFGGRIRAAVEAPPDRGRIIVTFQDGAAQQLSETFVTATNAAGRWELVGERVTLPVGTRKIGYRFDTARISGTTNDAYLDQAFVYVRSETEAPDLGAYSNSATDRDLATPHLAMRTPDLYVDWERDKPHTIQWDSFGNAADGPLKIDLLSDGPNGPDLVATLAANTSDTGQFTWTPANLGIAYGTPGLRIEISLAGNSAVFDRSTETFTVPENTNTFYVNDPSTANDEYTSALGSNRNTGKVPGAPKPYPNNVLRTYSLGANQTLHVDSGDYLLFDPILLSGTAGVADDEGFKLTGPETLTRIATLRLALAANSTPLIDLDDADFVTVTHLHLADAQHGLLAHNNSVNLTASYLTITGSALDAVRIDTGSTATTLDHLTVSNSNRYGIYADGAVGSLVSSEVSRGGAAGIVLVNSAGTLVDQVISHDNAGDGFVLSSTGAAQVRRSQSFKNRGRGISAGNGAPGMTTIGSTDLSLGFGNLVYDNAQSGIDVSGSVDVAGNVVYGHTNFGAAGINVFHAGQVTQNVIHHNYQGIVSNGLVTANRAYANATSGIVVFLGGVAQGNVSYSNVTGIQSGVGGYGNGSQMLGNLIYDNATHGIWFIPTYGSGGSKVVNNTIYQPLGDAIRLDSDSSNLNIRNNILAIGAGYTLRANAQNHPGFASDYNDFFVSGSGKVALWQGLDRPTLIAWQNTAFTDQNSLAQNPLFVDFDGADNVLGFASPAADGRDDDFHLQSLYGSFHGGALAPVISTTTGLPVFPAPTEVLDANQSPVIDRGAAADLFGSEPVPNGGYINIGAYGNTAQASKSPAEYVLVTRPDGGESWPIGRTFPIRWRSQIAGDQGTALQFDGVDDSVSFGNLGPRSAQGTIEFWMSSSVVENYRNVFTTGPLGADGSGNRAIRFEQYTGGTFAVVIGSDTADGFSGFSGAVYTTALAANRWYHVAVVWDSDQNRMIGYLDGVQVFDSPNTTWPSQFSNVTAGVGFATSRSWKGNIDELRIWTVARTAAEIQANMEASVLGNGAGLLARWRFDEGQGLVAADATGQFPGSLGGGVAASAPAWVSSFVAQGSVDIDLLSGSQVVSRLASATRNDGEFLWTVPETLPPGSNYSILVTRTEKALADASNAPFTITPPIHTYYVNEGVVNDTGDWTTAVGDDANDGLSPSTPKASVRAVLEAYDLDGNDTILVDAGTYNLAANLVITAGDSGVRIEGYHDPAFPTRSAVLNRGNQAGGNYVFELQNADDVTLSNLKITGANIGVFAADGADSDRLTVEASEIYGNSGFGIWWLSSNDDAVFSGNRLHDQGTGIQVQGPAAIVAGNTIFAHNTGLSLTGAATTVTNNDVYGNSTGISASGPSPTARLVISGNTVHDNRYTGIGAGDHTLIVGNTVYNQKIDGNSAGISVFGSVEVRNNTVYDNYVGIVGGQAAQVIGNRAFNNTTAGIVVYLYSVARDNIVYSNATGIQSGAGGYGNISQIYNNLIYANTDHGIWFIPSWGSTGATVINNTVYQPNGDAIRVDSYSNNLTLRNNIVWAGSGYALRFESPDQVGLASDYNVLHTTGAGKLARWQGRDFTSRVDWFYELGFDAHSSTADPLFVNPKGADGLLGYVSGADHSQDDDFHLLPTSPAIDAGNPADLFLLEPLPSGDRINIGSYGNTSQATTSAAQLVQILSPNGLEKFEVGQQVNVQWRSAGLTPSRAVLLINAGGPAIGNWRANSFQTVVNRVGSTTDPREGSLTDPIDLSGIANPAPEAIYQSYTWGNGLPGSYIAYQAPVPDGNYSVRLHFADPTFSAAGSRMFDIFLQGALASDNFDVAAAAGGRFKAVAPSFNVEASGGAGILVELVNVLSQCFINGIEITALNPAGVASPTVNLDLSTDSGLNWTTVASDLTLDGFGQGSYLWTAGPETNGNTALFRVRALVGSQPQDVSNAPFLIANAGKDYYVNDGSTAGDTFTTAIGDNANSGKSPNSPIASLAALMSAYDLDSGDVIHVDTGNYSLVRNIAIAAQDAGVKIEGPATAAAILNRGNQAGGNYVFELQNADDVTLSNLKITGANIGVFAADGADSDRLTVEASEIYGNSGFGIWWLSSNDDAVFSGNRLHDQGTGIQVQGPAALITGNTVFAHNTGLSLTGAATTVTNNDVYGNSTGISASGPSPTARLVISGNTVHDNRYAGIGAFDHVLIVGNTVYNQKIDGNSSGISVYGSIVEVRGNTVHDNYQGINAGSGQVIGNRVFNNTASGIAVYLYGVARDNIVYSNATGIQSGAGGYGNISQIYNNLIYANTDHGIWFIPTYGSGGVNVVNNTVYQPQGDAIRLDSYSNNLTIKNNILTVGAGYALRFESPNQLGLVSDYNVLYTTGTGKLGRWQDRDFTSRVDWFYELGFDAHSSIADPLFVNPAGADSLLGYASAADHGQDDDFHLQPASPAIDGGSPADPFLKEPVPSGDRINIGNYGNTSEATTSPAQTVQVLSPNGLEKFEVGQQVLVQWRSSGLTPSRPVALINAGGPTVQNWSADSFQSIIGGVGTINEPIDLSGVANPAPAAVYQFFAYQGGPPGGHLAYQFPVPDGSYQLRLHFVEPSATAAGQRVMDIFLQGALVRDDLDVFVDAGGRLRATTKSFFVTAAGGSGLSLDLENQTYNGAIVSGIELTALNPAGTASPAVDLDLSTDSGQTWSNIASGLVLDNFGNGSYLWTASPETDGNTALFRVRATAGSQPQDVSDAAFLIANNGADYYVNDASTTGDVFTTVIGDNANSGKSPNRPMASLAALLAAYDLDPGDMIHVDTGTYSLVRNVVITAQDSGVRIEGPTNSAAILNRGNQSGNVIELQNADDVTISRLSLTGGLHAVYAADGSDSDRVTIENSDIFGNQSGIRFEPSNDGEVIIANRVRDMTHFGGIGIAFVGTDSLASGNTITGSMDQSGIALAGPRNVARKNDVSGAALGITGGVGGGPENQIIVEDNVVHANRRAGIYVSDNILIRGNQVFGHLLQGDSTGIYAFGNSQILGNTVHDNRTGIIAYTRATGNRVYNNSVIGILTGLSGVVEGNYVYSNPIGIQSGIGGYYNAAQILNNLVYANTNQGILIGRTYTADGVKIVNNTVYQPVGDAVLLDGDTSNIIVKNNVLWIDTGYAIHAVGNHTNLSSDYNLVQQGADPNAHVGYIGGADRHSLADWQSITTQDAHSLAADAGFVDINGADNVLGYSSAVSGYDGGLDDNFYARKNASTIDRGDPAIAPPTDIEGQVRSDDLGTPNLGPGGTFIDLGAYEFRGSSADSSPPLVIGTLPDGVHAAAAVAPFSQLTITFSEGVNPIDARASAAYQLRIAGPDGIFDDGDDALYVLTPQLALDGSAVTLSITAPGGLLPVGKYRFTAFSNSTTSIHDLAGLALDGNSDGAEGGNYIRIFNVITPNQPPSFQAGPDQSATDESGPQTISGWATAISPGLPDDAGQLLTFIVTTDNDALFAVKPAIDSAGRLTFESLPNASGVVHVTVKLQDNGGTAAGGIDTSGPQIFVITITKPRIWHNTRNPVDVSGDLHVAPNDALDVINYINAFGSGLVPTSGALGPPYLDVNDDGFVAPNDALDVINVINAGFGAEGEAVLHGDSLSSLDAFYNDLGQQIPNPASASDALEDLIIALAGEATLPAKRRRP